jgi:hypothetical protein
MHLHPMMFQGEHNLFHRHVSLEDHPTGIEQHEARHQAQDKMTVVGVFGTGLTSFSSEKVFEDAEQLFDPVALIPSPNQACHLALYQHSCHGVQSSFNVLSVNELQPSSAVVLMSQQGI